MENNKDGLIIFIAGLISIIPYVFWWIIYILRFYFNIITPQGIILFVDIFYYPQILAGIIATVLGISNLRKNKNREKTIILGTTFGVLGLAMSFLLAFLAAGI